jgi:hypothetical protein
LKNNKWSALAGILAFLAGQGLAAQAADAAVAES